MIASLVLALVSAQPTELFRIERSKNANVVVYEAEPGTKTALAKKNPISASWIMLARDGKRANLSFFEKMLAYGFEVDLADDAETAALRLKALKGRPLKVMNLGGRLVAIGKIDGVDAVLQKVFVTTDERHAVPEVISIELFGVDPRTGEALSEKIVAK